MQNPPPLAATESIFAIFSESLAELACQQTKLAGLNQFTFSAKTWTGILDKINAKTDNFELLNRFLDAHLVHCIHNRQQTSVASDSTKLQPTPKGIACLETWFYELPKPKTERFAEVYDLLLSSYNSLDLLWLDRSLTTKKLYFSTGLVMIIWSRMFGTDPQSYDGPSHPQGVPEVALKRPSAVLNPLNVPKGIDVASRSLDPAGRESEAVPYFSKTMMHPNSVNLLHYWDTRGVRVFRNLKFERAKKNKFAKVEEYELEYVVSGHAVWQWIMDCTSVQSSYEGTILAREMLRNGFMTRITDPVIDALAGSFLQSSASKSISKHFLRNTLYQFTPRGRRLSLWGGMYLGNESVDQKSLEIETAFNDFCANPHLYSDDDQLHPNLSAGKSISSQVPRPPQSEAWEWEYTAEYSIDETYNGAVDLRIILGEPGLKLLFRETLRKMHSTASLDFLAASKRMSMLIRAHRESEGTVTRRSEITDELCEYLMYLKQQFIGDNAPLELNISEQHRLTWDAAMELSRSSKDFSCMEQILYAVTLECKDMLSGLVSTFNHGETTRKVPSLRHYLASKLVTPHALYT